MLENERTLARIIFERDTTILEISRRLASVLEESESIKQRIQVLEEENNALKNGKGKD
jgi:regulator of replication initiation timing